MPNFLCEREYKIIRKDGEIRWIHEFIKNICNESGIPIMVEGTIYDITDRKETELKLIESEEKFRSISEHFSLGIVIFQNSFVKYVNEAAAKICGYSVREILEWKQGEFQKLFHPEDLQLILEKTKKLQKGKKGDFDFYNVRIITKSGQIRYVEDYSKSISYENDLADLITIIDVTDKKIAENKLKESEEKYRHLFEDSPLAIFIADFDGKIVDCNEVVHKMSKYTKEELIGSNFIEFIKSQPDILSKLKRRLNNLIEGKKVLPIEFQTYKKDGVPFWIRLFTSIIEIDNLNFIQVIMQDITEQKIAEDLLKESEEKFKRIFHSIPDLFFMVAEDTTILDYKGRREDLYLPPEEFLTQRMCDILPPKEGKLVLETVKRTISTREPQVIEYSLPINNHIINFEARLLYFSDDLVAIFIRDISERKQAEFKLKESEERYRSFIENFQGIAFQGYQDFSAAFFHGLVEEITGYKEEDFLSGKINWEQLIHPIDKQRIYEQIKLFHESSEQSDVRKYRIINKTGEIRWLSEYTQKFYDEVKKEEGVRGICIDISNEKIAEQKLRESEEKFRNISEQALVGICILQNNSLIYANEAMAKINDVSIQELMTWDIKDLIGRVHKEHTSKAAKRLKSFKSGERKKTSDIYRMITKSNKIKWVEIFSNTFNYKGSPAIVTIIIDITERKEAEQKLLESEEKYRLITENVNDLLVILNPKFKMEYINEKAHKKILGYTKDDLIGKDILQLCHPDDIVKSLEEGKSKWRKREARLETRVRQKSGNYIWVELKGRRFLDDEGKEKFLFIGRDINERKKAEQELIESEEKYRLITENANDIIVVLDKKFKIEYINEQVHKVLGYKREELIGIDTLKLVYPDDAIIGINLWKTNYEKGEGSFEARMKRKDNSYIWLELKGKIFTDFDGKEKLLVIARDIDDRIKSENKLKESEEKYRNIFEKAIYGNVVMKYNKIIMCNEKESSLFGYTSPSDLNGRSVNELIHKDDLPILIDLERNIRKGKKMEHPIIFRGIRRDGKELFVEALAISFPFIEEDCILAFNMDVTERELAQQKLKESEEKYRLISENANDLIAVINEEFKQEYLNNLFYKILGYTRDEILKLSNKLVHPEDLQKLLDNSRKILETGEAAYEIRIKHKDGHYIYLEVNGRSFKDSDGRLKILTISRDITEKKAAEMELMEYRQHLEQMIEDRTRELVIANKQLQLEVDERKKVENELKRSEEKFKSIADLSQDIIVRANLDGKITFANPAAAEFFQKPAEQLIGIHFTEYTYPEDLEKTANALREIIKAGSPRIGFESRLIVPKGIRTVKFSGTVIKDNTGKITGVQATGRDVTELQEELIEKEKLAAVGQLAAGVAHELNTPLANITLKADYISAVVSNETNPPNVDILQKEISAIKDQVKFCAQIVKDLLQFSRKMDLNIKRFELSTLLTELIGLPAISSKIKEKNIEIIFEKEKDVILDADRVLLIQVFQNLIANSIDALENVKNEPKIRISISKINGSAEIKVFDNGIGIRESDLPRIFEPFFSTKQIGKGTGLGLSICRGIIEKHKGKININSIFGKGTEVVIKLPIQNEH
ncbi:MAG: PAS domain S-box protein [Promethearchaeota archaeon]